MRAVVTGGAGFIGCHLVDRLLADGWEVVVIDNMSTGRPANLEHVGNIGRLAIHDLDIVTLADDPTLFEGASTVFHLAALADIVPSINAPIGYHQANVDGTIAILEAARKTGVKKLLYAASSSCYGIPDEYPTPETAEARPQYPYALTKYVGEQYVMHWHQLYGLDAVALRLFNVYGPRSRTSGAYGAVFGVFLAQKLAGEPFTVVGDGTQTRDFTFVTDVVDAFVNAADRAPGGSVMNVGSGSTYSVNRLVELLDGEKIHIPKRPGEPDCTFADVTRIEQTLGWSASVSLEEGVARLLDEIDYWREAPVWTPDSIANETAGWFKYLARDTK